jgi:hypothetical protein
MYLADRTQELPSDAVPWMDESCAWLAALLSEPFDLSMATGVL